MSNVSINFIHFLRYYKHVTMSYEFQQINKKTQKITLRFLCVCFATIQRCDEFRSIALWQSRTIRSPAREFKDNRWKVTIQKEEKKNQRFFGSLLCTRQCLVQILDYSDLQIAMIYSISMRGRFHHNIISSFI